MLTSPTIVRVIKTAFFSFLLLIGCTQVISQAHEQPALAPVAGRWDITIDNNGKQQPSWLGVWLSGNNTLVGEFVASGGSARPVSKVFTSNDSFYFSIPPQWDRDTSDMMVRGTVKGNEASGIIINSNGKQNSWTAMRAPALVRTKAPVWGKPIALFNGKDLSGWHAMGDNQWVAENGVLKSPHSGSNLVSDKTFNDFKLHVEFRYPAGSNSGVYLRGRYELQIEDGDTVHPTMDRLGAVYGFIAPSENAAKKAGDWQTYDVILTGRLVTVMLNGVTTISNREIPGITGGALDSKEGEPGPLQFQGDHGPIEFRNITLTPAQ